MAVYNVYMTLQILLLYFKCKKVLSVLAFSFLGEFSKTNLQSSAPFKVAVIASGLTQTSET